MASHELVKRIILCTFLLTACLLPSCAPQRTPTAAPSPTPVHTPTIAAADIRPPAVDGTFYPDDPAQLQEMVDDLLSQA